MTVLPVEVAYFSGVTSDYGTSLNWATKSEVNNSHFEVQRSLDGSVWETIGVVEGNWNSVEENEYEFVDQSNTADKLFFRLKQVDFDGAFKYTNVITMNKENNLVELAVMKNGSQPVVSVNGLNEGTLHILSMSGKSVWNKPIMNGYWLDLNFLPNGNYIAVVNTESGVLSEKITVIK